MASDTDIKSMFSALRELRSTSVSTKDIPETEKGLRPEAENYTCSFCQERTLIEDDGIIVCTSCSREKGPVITSAQEWRSFSDSAATRQDPSRCGMPVNPLLPQSSLGTVIQGQGSQSYRKLQLQNAMPAHEKSLWEAIKNIAAVARKAQIKGVLADKACYLYAILAQNEKLKRGNSRKGLQAYCLYAFCKDKKRRCYVAPETLAKLFGISITDFREGAKIFAQISYRKSQTPEGTDHAWSNKFRENRLSFVKPTSPENYIQKAGSGLKLTEKQIAEIIYISRVCAKLGLVAEKMPQSIAAGCIILYVKEKKVKLSTKKISEICGVSDITANGTYKELRQGKKYLFPSESNDIMKGSVGDCRPPKRLEMIYKAPSHAIPPAVRIRTKPKKVNQ